jgi:hypothetical protein
MDEESYLFGTNSYSKAFYLRFCNLIFGVLESKFVYENVASYATKEVLSNFIECAGKINRRIGIVKTANKHIEDIQENKKRKLICNSIKTTKISDNLELMQGIFIKNCKAILIRLEVSVIQGKHKVVKLDTL